MIDSPSTAAAHAGPESLVSDLLARCPDAGGVLNRVGVGAGERDGELICGRYFLGAIAVMLTAGASWGAWLLWQIGFAGSFTAAGIHQINAHGHAQIFGWVGLFIMGAAYQIFPRLWQTQLVGPAWAKINFVLMIVGISLRTIGMTMADTGGPAVALAMFGGGIEVFAIAAFCVQAVLTFRRSSLSLEPYIGFILAALACFLIQALLSLWHSWTTMTAATTEQLLWYVATYQAVLRDIQIHGLAMLMILGVSLHTLPRMWGVQPTSAQRAWWGLAVLLAALVLGAGFFLLYRHSGVHALAALMLIPWIMLPVGAWLVAGPWQLWRPACRPDRSFKFVRAAYGWLMLSLVMLLLLPIYGMVSGLAFSHAYYGSVRHAITVGFISMMIMGMSAKVVAALKGVDTQTLTALWGPFLLINVGCGLRVSFQTLTDWHPMFFMIVGISGLLEVAALAWWGVHLVCLMWRDRRCAPATPTIAVDDEGRASTFA